MRLIATIAMVAALTGPAHAMSDGVGRPIGCPTRNWCGCYQGYQKGIDPSRSKAMGLWKASNWIKYGSGSVCQPGAVAVMPHHVGEVLACEGAKVTIKSGNHGGRVGVGKYPRHRIMGFRL